MVFVGDRKYACETCIKGHRSSTCKHTDRPLFEIKKKGRPVTQCEHCRELRKTKQVHVKCMCGLKDDGEGASVSGQGGVKAPAGAAFPSGLPETLETSVTLQMLSDGSDSEHGSSASCNCKNTGSCHCATPRAPRTKRYGKATKSRGSRGSVDGHRPASREDSPPRMSQPAALVVNANSGDYRPVLPRPAQPQLVFSSAGPTHDASLASKAHASRFQSNSQMHYSPYGRAYEYMHSSDAERSIVQYQATDAFSAVAPPIPSWVSTLNVPPIGGSSSVLCGCGPSCGCPGCAEHRGPNVDAAAPCENPATCMSCLDCAMFSLPESLPPGTEERIEAPQLQAIDDWIRQVSSTASITTLQSHSPSGSIGSHAVDPPPHSLPGQFDMRFDPNMLQTYALWGEMQGGPLAHATPAPEECCGGRCKCPAGFCTCAADCCGCCQGCECAECEHSEDPNRMLTFAVSGERAPCCSGRRASGSALGPPAFLPPIAMNTNERRGMDGGWNDQSLEVVRTSLSRASSFSSGSSSHLSYTSTPGSGYDRAGPPRSVGGDVQAIRACCTGLQEMNTGMGREESPSTVRRTY
ncbi:hypothetical protein B0H21DRAFT_763171 [Amylocystis lapponica]|nr:hypothetical protein B0H21DRAFT_763171 [Amylocystis lapponica]